jgi:hypothetical protein
MGQLESTCSAPTRRGTGKLKARSHLIKLLVFAPLIRIQLDLELESTPDLVTQPLNLSKVISWFQAFAFKWVRLHRYTPAAAAERRKQEAAAKKEEAARRGAARWNQVDP